MLKYKEITQEAKNEMIKKFKINLTHAILGLEEYAKINNGVSIKCIEATIQEAIEQTDPYRCWWETVNHYPIFEKLFFEKMDLWRLLEELTNNLVIDEYHYF